MKELYLFGSVITGDVDSGSDVDVLVVIDDLKNRENYPDAWSVYSRQRIEELFRAGTLFSWHLYLDAILIYPSTSLGLIQSIGEPSEYTSYIVEVEQLVKLARNSVEEIESCTKSWIYEYGLLYVAARDIAMASFKKLNDRFVFSRFAPFELKRNIFPFTKKEYEYLMQCRRATTRGLKVIPNTTIQQMIEHKCDDFLHWCENILGSIKK